MGERRSEFRGPHTATEGFYRVKLVRRGPMVPAELRWENDRIVAYIDGKKSVGELDGWQQDAVDRIAIWGEPIDEAEHRYMVAFAAHARVHMPDHPVANPMKPINLRLVSPAHIYRGKSA